MDFNNLDELMLYLQKELTDSMVDVGIMGAEKVKEHIDLDVYSAGNESEEHYQRTYELRDSVIPTISPNADGSVDALIHHDDSMIHSNLPNQHHSVVKDYNPQDSSEFIADIVEYGESGKIFGEGYWTRPRPFWQYAEDEILTHDLDVITLKNSLIAKGIEVE